MKRFVAVCPVTEIAMIVAVSETGVLPAEGTTISIPCPACREQHDMRVRDPQHVRRAS
jgi:hypothetical protein